MVGLRQAIKHLKMLIGRTERVVAQAHTRLAGLFAGVRPGRHLTAQTIMQRLRSLGINVLGARNTALQRLAEEIPGCVHRPLSQSYRAVS